MTGRDPIQIMRIRQASASHAWHYFTQNFLGLDVEVSYQIWQALERADEARGLLFSWQKMCRSPGQVHLIIGLLDSHLLPTRFLPLIDRLVAQGLLDRATESTIAEAVLARTSKTGQWVNEPP